VFHSKVRYRIHVFPTELNRVSDLSASGHLLNAAFLFLHYLLNHLCWGNVFHGESSMVLQASARLAMLDKEDAQMINEFRLYLMQVTNDIPSVRDQKIQGIDMVFCDIATERRIWSCDIAASHTLSLCSPAQHMTSTWPERQRCILCPLAHLCGMRSSMLTEVQLLSEPKKSQMNYFRPRQWKRRQPA
jgi:hypothetical protein